MINPAKPPAAHHDRLNNLVARWQRFEHVMASGERHVDDQDWSPAQASFREALKLAPGNQRASESLMQRAP